MRGSKIMKATIISHSQTPKVEVPQDALDLIAYCARVSNPENQANTTTNEKLVKYLMKHKHWSPLEMVSVCMEIETTRDRARQLLRRRSFSVQEFSQRYADPTQSLSFEIRQARLQDPVNRQNSIELDPEMDGHAVLQGTWKNKQQRVVDAALDAYTWALSNGIAKEQARVVLPEGNTLSRLYVNGTLRSWIHYIELRGANGTQLEHMELAHAVADAITEIFPIAEEFKNKKI